MVVRGLDRHSGRDDHCCGDFALRVTVAPPFFVPRVAAALSLDAFLPSVSKAEIADQTFAKMFISWKDWIGATFVSAE